MTTAWAAGTLAALLLIATSAPAEAQPGSRFYVGGSLGGFSVSGDDVDDASAAFGLSCGLTLSKFVDVEMDVVIPSGTLTQSYTGGSVSFAPFGSSVAERERLTVITQFDTHRDVTASISGVVVIHPSREHRLTPGFIVGVANQTVRDRRTYTPILIPEGVDPLHPSVVARSESATRNIGGPTVGGQLAIALSPRLTIVPDVRYDYGSIGDEINNTLRTSIRVQWRF